MIARAVAKLLDAQIAGLTFTSDGQSGGNIFVGWMPDSPDRCVAVMPGAPLPQLSKLPTDIPTVQLIVRDGVGQYAAAHDLAEACRSAVDCLPAQVLDPAGPDEVVIIGATADQSGPIDMGRDQKDRPEFSVNTTWRTHNPSTHRPAVPA